MRILGALFLICLSLHWQRAVAVLPLCSKQTLAGKIQNVLTPVRYYGPVDRRGPLSKKAKEFSLTKAEIAQIRKSFGFVFCQPDPSKKPFLGGGFLAENNCEVWTVSHNLQYPDGQAIDLKDCGFQNFEIPGKRTGFDVKSKRNIISWALGDKGKTDRARLRLKDCIPGATPFLVEDVQMKPGSEYMTVMADNSDIAPSAEPILAPGHVEDDETLTDGTRLLYTSNDQDKGASGGINVVRSKGRLAVRAMHVEMGFPLKTFKPGDPADGTPYNRAFNHNVDIELSGPVLKALKAP